MASVEGLTGAIDAAPELVNSPGLALAASNTSDPQGTAETLAGASQFTGAAQAVSQFQQSQPAGMTAGLAANAGQPGVLKVAGEGLNLLNAPLQQVQHTYRYIRDVYHRHGLFAGIMETLGAVAGGVVGGIAGTFTMGDPVLGAIGGAELAGRLEGFSYGDSWKATASPHYMLNGHLVSPGRDLISLLGFHPNKQGNFTGWGSVLSGLTDAGVDWYADPLMVAGKVRGFARTQTGARDILSARWGLNDEQAIQDSGNRVAQFLYRFAPGTGLNAKYPDAAAIAYQRGGSTGSVYAPVRRAVDWLAQQTPERMGQVNAEQVERAKGLIDDRLSAVNEQLSGLNPETPDVQQATQFAQLDAVRQRLESLDPKTLVAVGHIVGQFPELAPLAEELAKAETPTEVLSVFRSSLFNDEMIGRMSRSALPSRTLMRAGFQRIGDKIADQDLSRQQEQGALFSLGQGLQIKQGAVGTALAGHPLQGLAKYASRKLRTFTGYAPFTPDRNTLALGYEFDPKDPNAAQGILRALKFGMGSRTGELWTAIMLHAANTGDTALAKKIWAEGMVENLKAMGLPDDAELVDYVTRKSRFYAQGSLPSQQYAVGHYGGDDISMVKTSAGSSHLGLYNYQRGMLAYPDFMRAKAALRQMSAYTKVFGKMDDFAAEHYTNSFFKPLALVTMGFGLRIALNEALIGTAKYGTPAYLTQMANQRLAKYGYSKANLLDGFQNAELNEQVQMMKAAITAAGGWQKYAAGLIPDDKLDLALRVVAENDGHIVKGVIAAGHSGYGVPDDGPGRASYELHYLMQRDQGRFSFQRRATSQMPNGSYESIPHDASHFEDAYLAALARRANEPSVQLIANDLRLAMARSDQAAYEAPKGTISAADQTTRKALPGVNGSPLTAEQALANMELPPGEILPAEGDASAGAGALGPEDRIHNAFLYAVSRERKRIEGVDPETDVFFQPGKDPYSGERKTISRYLAQTPHEFANDRVDDVLNMIVGRDGTFHSHLANKLAEGQPIARGDVSKIGADALPRKIAGEALDPWVGPGLWQATLQGMYKRLVDPVVNHLSREPLFLNSVEKHYKALQGAVDRGIIDDRDALRFAQYRAMNEMLPMIHNTALRSQFGLLVRNIAPFYFAQEQAMRRAGKAVMDSPSVLARWQLVSHYMSDPAWVHKDDNGQTYAVYPGIGAFGSFLTSALGHLGVPVIGGLPLTATGDTGSLQTVLPELRVPSASPMLSVPLSWITNADPLIAPLTQDVLGDRGFKQNVLNSAVPNAFLRDAFMAMTGDSSYSSFSNAYLAAIASAYYHGDLPTPADYEGNGWKAQQKMDKVRNNARTLFAMKGILSLFAPMSPTIEGDLGLQQDWQQVLSQNGNQPGLALDTYLAKHGENSIGFTVSHTENKVGAYIPYTTDVQNFIADNLPLIKNHPLAMSYLMPQSGTTGAVQVVHDELARLALKTQRTPDDFLQAIYQAQGERLWRASEQNYYNAKGPGPDPLLTQAWQAWQQQFRLWNPVAYNYIKDPSRPTRALYIWNDLKSVYNQGLAPDTPQAQAVGQLLQGFDQHWQEMSGLVAARAQTASTQLSEQYHQYLVQLAQQIPDLDSVIYNVFMHLDGVLTGNA